MNIQDVKHKEHTISGIYFVQNNINGKIYIGSSVNIYYRIKGHISTLYKNTKHSNSNLRKAILKYGIDNFNLYMYQYDCNITKLREYEKYWIDLLKPEYNIQLDPINYIMTDEIKKSISKTLKRKYASGEIVSPKHPDSKQMKVYNLEWEFIEEFESIAKMCKKYNWIKETLRGRIKKGQHYYKSYFIIPSDVTSIKNYITSFVKSYKTFTPIVHVNKDGKITFINEPYVQTKLNRSKNTKVILRKRTGYFTYLGLPNCPF